MNASELLHGVGETLGSTATARSVFGEPIRVAGKTVVPVAKVAYGFGGGFGSGEGKHGVDPDGKRHGEGGGGGGGIRAFPAGALEISESGTRFIPFHDFRWLIGAFAAGAVVAGIFGRRK